MSGSWIGYGCKHEVLYFKGFCIQISYSPVECCDNVVHLEVIVV